eukprot:TRINITY_DN6632_c0_g1_i1.p1 TRINITY_DN6632_c0_g1~~TRINITY_DN6632_c0_g1_i1.p1  ORF type:complete len:458 (+),score=17.27 TRINITY_DN6632_c0_g1_i1:196-1374(+)
MNLTADYEKWLDEAHERSDLTVIGVSHIKMNFFPMKSGGCLKGMSKINKISNRVWVPMNDYKKPVCFWDCIAAALHPELKEKMRKHGNAKTKELNERSDAIRIKVYNAIGEEPKCEMVPLCDIPKYAKILEMNILVYTLVEEGNLKIAKEIIGYDIGYPRTVMLHFHTEKDGPGHYCLIDSLVGYGDMLSCPRCRENFILKRADRYHMHVAKCERVFKGDIHPKFNEAEVKKKKSKAWGVLGYDIPKEIVVYFDFESTLKPVSKESHSEGGLRELNRQEPNAYVLKVWDHKNNCELTQFRRRVLSSDAARDLSNYLIKIEGGIKSILIKRYIKNYQNLVHIASMNYVPKNQKKPKNQKNKLANPSFIEKGIMDEFLRIPVYAFNGGHYDTIC